MIGKALNLECGRRLVADHDEPRQVRPVLAAAIDQSAAVVRRPADEQGQCPTLFCGERVRLTREEPNLLPLEVTF